MIDIKIGDFIIVNEEFKVNYRKQKKVHTFYDKSRVENPVKVKVKTKYSVLSQHLTIPYESISKVINKKTHPEYYI